MAGTAREVLRLRLESQWITGAPMTASASTAGEAATAGTDVWETATAARSTNGGVSSGSAAATMGGTRIATVAAHMLATQAQDFGQAVWALGLRAPGSTRAEVLAALDSGAVVRSWPMRGTLHFSTPDDLRWMLALTATRTIAGAATRHRQLGLDQAAFDRASAIARSELAGGGALSREEFLTALAAGGVDPAGQRGMHLIWRLAHDGLVCWGPSRGTQQALVLLDEWAPATREPSRDEALRAFVLRYLAGHGPATVDDFCWWSKSTLADARHGWSLARDQLTELVVDDTSYWMLASPDPATSTTETPAGTRDPSSASTHGPTGTHGPTDTHGASPAGTRGLTGTGGISPTDTPGTGPTGTRAISPAGTRGPTGVHALPGFDEYLLGYRTRTLALPAEHAERIVPGGNGMFLPMLVSRGRIVGTWKRSVGAKSVTLGAEPFESLSATEQRGVEREFARYGRFLGLPAKTNQPTPTPGPATARAPKPLPANANTSTSTSTSTSTTATTKTTAPA